MSAGFALPGLDTFYIAKVYAALADSPWADAAQRNAVAQDSHPGTKAARERMRSARQYHADQAVKAVIRGLRGVVFAACGFPAEPEPHTAAAVACPDARFCFIDADEDVARVNWAELCEAGRVDACAASLRDPGRLLGCPQVKELPGPLHLQAQMTIQFWPPGIARSLIGDYARLLAAGDEMLLTWTLPSRTDAGRRLMELASDISRAPVYRHTAKTVAGWLDDAGFRVDGAGPADVRGWVPAWAERARAQAPARVMGVVARKP